MPKDLEKMLKEMKNAKGMIGFWMKGSGIDLMLKEWVQTTTKYVYIFNLTNMEKVRVNAKKEV